MSEVMKYEITSTDGVTLETEGRICSRHIRVVPRLAPLEVELGGSYPVPDGYTGYGDVKVNPKLLPLTVNKAGTYPVPEGYAGHGEVKFEPLLTNLKVTSNGTYTVPEGFMGYDEIEVAVYGAIAPVNKTITLLASGHFDDEKYGFIDPRDFGIDPSSNRYWLEDVVIAGPIINSDYAWDQDLEEYVYPNWSYEEDFDNNLCIHVRIDEVSGVCRYLYIFNDNASELLAKYTIITG